MQRPYVDHENLDPEAIPDPETDGLETEFDRRRAYYGTGHTKASEVVASLLADLDRQWGIPPTELAREIAREAVVALAQQPVLWRGLVGDIAAAVARHLKPRHVDDLLYDLEMLGIRARVGEDPGKGAVLVLGPGQRVKGLSDRLRQEIAERRADLIAHLQKRQGNDQDDRPPPPPPVGGGTPTGAPRSPSGPKQSPPAAATRAA